jgi:hypothetical protein
VSSRASKKGLCSVSSGRAWAELVHLDVRV